jgi:tRNA 2-thiouridine synthesizing protein A
MKKASGDRWRIDCRRMPAPFPLLGARAAMRLMAPGDLLALLASDADAVTDVPAWCRMTGHELLRRRRAGAVTGFLIRKRERGRN